MQIKNLVGACASIPLAVGLSSPALADARTQEIQAQLKEYKANQKAFYQKGPKKLRPQHGKAHVAKFNAQHKDKIHQHKQSHRIKKMKKMRRAEGKEAPAYNDRARALVDTPAGAYLERLDVQEQRGLMTGKLPETPWSDDYWAIYSLGLAKRYADPSVASGTNWKQNAEALKKAWTRPLNPAEIDKMSPAEKYDLLVGDTSRGLTMNQINEGAGYAKPDGTGVETWMGHCHGWAPAAYMVQRPKHKIVVRDATNRYDIPFYPADIRALGTLLWASTNPPTRFIGGRCNTKAPPADPATGRINEAGCRDVNPRSWHNAIVNQVGVSKRSFVLDVTFDYEVWNQPIYKYQYSYFNPKTAQPAPTLAAAKVAVPDASDKFARWRAPGTKSIVGIAMDVHWVVETQPRHGPIPASANDDLTHGARWLYTLELDANNNILGGEWLQKDHPDFLWTPPANTHARADVESGPVVAAANGWNAKTALPTNVAQMARQASRAGEPLGSIIEALAKRSALGN